MEITKEQFYDETEYLNRQAERATGSGDPLDYLLLLIAEDMIQYGSGNSLADRMGATQ